MQPQLRLTIVSPVGTFKEMTIHFNRSAIDKHWHIALCGHMVINDGRCNLLCQCLDHASQGVHLILAKAAEIFAETPA